MDFQSAISVNSTGNSRSFTELTDRLAFANFSSPAMDYNYMDRRSDPNLFGLSDETINQDPVSL